MNCQEANQVQFYVNVNKILSGGKEKDRIIQQIVFAIHALLNTKGGGILELLFSNQRSEAENKFIHIIEQKLLGSIATQKLTSHITFGPYRDGKIYCTVKESDTLITANYNLYVPSNTQANKIPSTEEIDAILKRQHVPQPVPIRSHQKEFIIDIQCGFTENKNTEFKYLTASPSTRITLADRMTGKANKFSCYVSAFANYSGGHIYYGITDEGIVKGEFIPNEKDKGEIIKKVEKVIKKIIWPEQIRQPKQGKQWEIFFEPVKDPNSKPVPSTFVIVIYIAPCLGGVFTEEPECYEIVEGVVQKMSFDTWKKRTLEPVCGKEEIPCSVARVTWHSAATQKTFTDVSEKLRELINDGKWDDMSRLSASLEEQSPSCEMKLVVLSNQATASYRRGHFNDARLRLKEYMAILPEVKDNLIFEVMGLYIDAALKWARGDLHDLKSAVSEALAKAELIEPGLVTATVYSFAASVSDLISLQYPTNNKISNNEKILSIRALEHKEYVKDCDSFCTDVEQKVHITLASVDLRCNLSGQSLKDNITASDLKNARCRLKYVRESMIHENPPVSRYYTVQSKLLESIYRYRRSQVCPDKRVNYLRKAFKYANEAECAARDCQFLEMVEWSKTNKALFTEELVRAKLIELNLPFTIDPKV